MMLFIVVGNIHGQPGKIKKVQKIIDKATQKYLVGVAVYIKMDGLEEWIGVAGLQDKEHNKMLEAKNIFAAASIGKMYNAVAALKLVEEGYFKLDDPISLYLSNEIVSNLPNGQQITIRHLLSHQTGLYNYENNPELNELYLSGKLKLDTLTHENALKRYVFGRAASMRPGTGFEYSSTNFMLLAMIMDKVLPQQHTAYLRMLLAAGGYNNTYYRQTPPNNFINYYGDLNKDTQLENLTSQTIETTNWFTGDDGIYAPIDEAAHFLQDLMAGKIIKQESLQQMMTWNNEKKPDYGLGLMADKSFPYKFLLGHSGRGIGTTTDLFYFPKQKMTIGIFCNTGIRQTSPEIKAAYMKMRSKIVKKIFLL